MNTYRHRLHKLSLCWKLNTFLSLWSCEESRLKLFINLWRPGVHRLHVFYIFVFPLPPEYDQEQPWLVYVACRVLFYSSDFWYAKEIIVEKHMGRETLRKLWQKYQVDIVFYGHVHDYERPCLCFRYEQVICMLILYGFLACKSMLDIQLILDFNYLFVAAYTEFIRIQFIKMPWSYAFDFKLNRSICIWLQTKQ